MVAHNHHSVTVFSIYCRQDYDQCARKYVQLGLGIEDPDYYEFEGNEVMTCLLIAIFKSNIIDVLLNWQLAT